MCLRTKKKLFLRNFFCSRNLARSRQKNILYM